MSRFRAPVLLLAALAALSAGAARADLLVTRDGATIETRGPWRVEGRQIVFTLPNGTLSSIRADTIDLDRSAVATASARLAAAAPDPSPVRPLPPGEPVWRITDKDLEPPPPDPSEADADAENPDDPDYEAAADGEGTGAAGGGSEGPLEVLSWDRLDMPTGDGVELFGTLRNNGAEAVIAPGLTVLVYGERGGLLATADGSVNQPSIAPGQTANFRAALPGITEFAAVRFNLAGRGYEVRSETSESAQAEAAERPEPEPEVDPDPGAQYDYLLDADSYAEAYEEEPLDEEPVEEATWVDEPQDDEPLDEEPVEEATWVDEPQDDEPLDEEPPAA